MIIFAITYLISNVLFILNYNQLILPWIAINLIAILLLRNTKVFEKIILAIIVSSFVFNIHSYLENKSFSSENQQEFSAVLYESEVRYEDYSSAMAKVTVLNQTFKAKIYFTNEYYELTIDDVIYGTGYFYQPTNKNGFNAINYYKSQGINWLCSVYDYEITRSESNSFGQYVDNVRKSIDNNLSSLFDERNASILKGLILGDKSDFTSQDKIDFNKVGISHVLAISGLHISFLCSICLHFFGKREGLYISCIVILLYGAIIGFSPSVTRAIIMQLMLVFCWHNSYKYTSIDALSVALVFLLAQNPYIIYDVGFILSFVSSFSIIVLSPKLYMHLKVSNYRFNKFLIMPISVYLSIFFTTIIPLGYYFGYVSTISMISNILVLPLVSILFPATVTILIISFLFYGLANLLTFLAQIPLAIILNIIEHLANFKYAMVTPRSWYYGTIFIILLVLLTLLYFKIKSKLTILCSLCMLLSCNLIFSYIDFNQDYINIFSVGDGQAVLVKYNDEISLIDCGSSGYVNSAKQVNEFMYLNGLEHIDHLFITSIDKSHINDINALDFTVSNVYYPLKVANNTYFEKLELFLASNDVTVNPDPPDYFEIYDDIDKKLVIKFDDYLFLHALTNLMIDNFLDIHEITTETVVISDKTIIDAMWLYEQLSKLCVSNVILSNDTDQIDTVSKFPCKSTIKYGDIKLLVEE